MVKLKKGITLISLIITIVVLIILTATIIYTMTDSNLIGKAEKAKKLQNITQEEEIVRMAALSAKVKSEGIEITTGRLENELKKQFKENYGELIEDDGWIYIGKISSYYISKDGIVDRKTQDLNYIIYGNCEKILPDEYQQVEYIETTGSQYINTGVYLPYQADFDIYYKNKKTNVVGNVGFGYYNDNGFTFEEQPWTLANAKNILIFGIKVEEGYSFPSGYFTNIRHLELKQNELYVDGELFSTYERKGEKIASHPLLLGAFWEANSKRYNSGIIMGRMIFSHNGINLFDGIPCYNKENGTIGMYDTVTKTFFNNSGSGNFSKGMDVNTNCYVGNKNESGKYEIPLKIITGSGEQEMTIVLDNPLKKVNNVADYLNLKNKKVVRNIGTDDKILEKSIEENVVIENMPDILEIRSIEVKTNIEPSKIEIIK